MDKWERLRGIQFHCKRKLSMRDIDDALHAYAEYLKENLVEGRRVVFTGLGVFTTKNVEDRLYNTASLCDIGKDEIFVPQHREPEFRFSEDFKKEVREATRGLTDERLQELLREVDD